MKPAAATPATLYFSDARTTENKAHPVTGRISMELTSSDGKPFDPVTWLAGATAKELAARGLPAQLANPRATNQLVNLTSSTDGYVMRAALSSLGVLHADQHFDLLVRHAEKTKGDFEDRAAALKAIGDLGTPQARAYLEKERARLDKLTDAEAVRAKGLIGLYLD